MKKTTRSFTSVADNHKPASILGNFTRNSTSLSGYLSATISAAIKLAITPIPMESMESEPPQCGLCSKASAQAVRIAKCSHIYCTLCLLDYLAKRRYCPICVPKKAKSGFLSKYLLTYLHPLKLIKKIKKHNKKIARKHLIPITATNRHHGANQAGETFDSSFRA